MRDLSKAAAKVAPKAHMLIISNPVNSTVPIVAEVFKRAGVYDPKRLFGVTTLDVTRASTFLSGIAGSVPADTNVPVVGGHSGVTIVPLLSQAKQGSAVQAGEQYEKLVHRIQFGGDEVVKAKDGAGSATLSMAYAAARFSNSLLKALQQEALEQMPEAQWLPRRQLIDELLDVSDVTCAWKAISLHRDSSDPLIARAAKTMTEGSPLTAHLVWEQISRARHMSLAEVFQMEYTLSLNCCRHPEFSEGVRARLIDKDQKPHWHWPDISSVPDAVVEAHFHKVWEGRHPLADLTQY